MYFYLQGQEYPHLRSRLQGPYRHVRHPLYVGWLITFWATPTMTGAHLLFVPATTAYILVAIQFEEKDLVRFHGRRYETYRQAVPMIVPSLTPRHQSEVESVGDA